MFQRGTFIVMAKIFLMYKKQQSNSLKTQCKLLIIKNLMFKKLLGFNIIKC